MISSLTNERKNFIKVFLFKKTWYLPVLFFKLGYHLLIKFLIKTIKLCKGSYNKQKVSQTVLDTSKISFSWPVNIIDCEKLKCIQKVKLASTILILNKGLDWRKIYTDIEDSYSLHRFGWLLTLMLKYPSKKNAIKSIYWINDWIKVCSDTKDHHAWESYSVSERIVNWIIILQISSYVHKLSYIQKDLFINEIYNHCIFLNKNIEYHGKLTNNHIINNGRALYLGGCFLNLPEISSKGRKIFKKWTTSFFSNNGMLKENSSHYHFLLTQRYSQVYYFSQYYNDKEFTKFLEKWVKLMEDCCHFFSVYDEKDKWLIPLIGDISPDFPPLWFSPKTDSPWSVMKRIFNWS